MVSSVGSSINSLLAANYSQVGQTASAQQLRTEELAAKARLQAEEALKAQQTVLPVSRDGRSPSQGGGAFVDIDQRRHSLRDFSRTKPDLLPTDELQLFGIAAEPEVSVAAPTAQTIFEQASDGVFYAVNDNTAARTSQAETEARRNQTTRQQQVADLYQRNFNAQFTAEPAYTVAA